MFSNRLDNLLNSFDKKNIISCCQNRDVTSLRLSVTRWNSVVSHTKIDKNNLRMNRDGDHTETHKSALKKNEKAGDSKIKEEMSSANRVMFNVNFLH